ncbi:MAG TPA: U32 family peptidase, partial [bacterium]|nr:U32 family peptidase [bacterium]
MKILAPVNHVSEVEPLERAGASELYCGLMRAETVKEYTNVFSLNSRHTSEANIASHEDLEELTRKAHSLGMKVFITYNALYPDDQFRTLTGELADSVACGVDGVIAADISLMKHLREKH